MAHLVGIDLGSYAVKAVVLETNLRGHQVRAFTQARVGEGERLESLAKTLKELFAQRTFHADQVVVSLPGRSLATHLVTLPFTDSKRIDAALPFEVESQLPFDIEEVVFDYQVVGRHEKQSDLLVGVVKKDELLALLSLLKEQKLDPRIVIHPGVAYHTLLLGMPPGETVAIVDLGHERTSVAIGKAGSGVELARTFAGGAKDGLGQSRLQGILRELRPTLRAHAARTRNPVSRLCLCGGAARTPGIDEQLSRELGISVERLRLPPEAKLAISEEDEAVAPLAYALALRGKAASAEARFNFRRGELAFKGDFDYLRGKLGRLASFAAILFLLLIASGVVKSSVLSRREREVDALLCETTQRVLGRCEKDYNRALNMLRGKESPVASLPRLSAVNLLAELTQRLPEGSPITIDQVVVDLERITVRIETDSPKQIDKITSALRAYKCFKEVQEGKMEKTRDGQKVTFRLDIRVECG